MAEEHFGVVISSAIWGRELRQLEKKGIELTELQNRALRERVAYLTAVKRGLPFKGLPEKDTWTALIK